MIQDLDETIRALLTQEVDDVRSGQVTVSFAQPTRSWMADVGETTINFFLYDVRDNPILRQHQWEIPEDGRLIVKGNNHVRQKRTPLRMDCFYLVTVWSHATEPRFRPSEEHRLLAECLMALARYPILNRADEELLVLGQQLNWTKTLLVGADFEDDDVDNGAAPAQGNGQENRRAQPFLRGQLATTSHEIPTRLAYHDVMTNPAELWGSLDNDIRAGFSYVVNLPLEPWQKITHEMGEVGGSTFLPTPPQNGTEGKALEPVRLDPTQYSEPPTLLGGVIKKIIKHKEPQLDGKEKEVEIEVPYANVEVWIPERGRSTKTDAQGRFVFRRLPAGTYTIEVRTAENKPVLAQTTITVSAGLTERISGIAITVPLQS